jgi:hypothetical protein
MQRASRDPGDDLLVGVEAEHAPVAEDQRVHRVALRLVARSDDRLLVRDRDVRAGEALCTQIVDRLDDVEHVERDVLPVVKPRGREGRVLHLRRPRVRDGMPEQRDAVQQPYPCWQR